MRDKPRLSALGTRGRNWKTGIDRGRVAGKPALCPPNPRRFHAKTCRVSKKIGKQVSPASLRSEPGHREQSSRKDPLARPRMAERANWIAILAKFARLPCATNGSSPHFWLVAKSREIQFAELQPRPIAANRRPRLGEPPLRGYGLKPTAPLLGEVYRLMGTDALKSPSRQLPTVWFTVSVASVIALLAQACVVTAFLSGRIREPYPALILPSFDQVLVDDEDHTVCKFLAPRLDVELTGGQRIRVPLHDLFPGTGQKAYWIIARLAAPSTDAAWRPSLPSYGFPIEASPMPLAVRQHMFHRLDALGLPRKPLRLVVTWEYRRFRVKGEYRQLPSQVYQTVTIAAPLSEG